MKSLPSQGDVNSLTSKDSNYLWFIDVYVTIKWWTVWKDADILQLRPTDICSHARECNQVETSEKTNVHMMEFKEYQHGQGTACNATRCSYVPVMPFSPLQGCIIITDIRVRACLGYIDNSQVLHATFLCSKLLLRWPLMRKDCSI